MGTRSFFLSVFFGFLIVSFSRDLLRLRPLELARDSAETVLRRLSRERCLLLVRDLPEDSLERPAAVRDLVDESLERELLRLEGFEVSADRTIRPDRSFVPSSSRFPMTGILDLFSRLVPGAQIPVVS